MIELTLTNLSQACGARIDRAQMFLPHLIEGMTAYGILDTKPRACYFLAQIGHESEGLHYTTELWGTPQQLRYERDFNAPWPTSPEEAKGTEFSVNRLAYTLGNTQAGDGSLFRGHALLQVTGRFNHARIRDRLRAVFHGVPDFEADPHALAEARWAALASCDFVDWKNLNPLADAGDFLTYVHRVNGGENGLPDRRARLVICERVL